MLWKLFLQKLGTVAQPRGVTIFGTCAGVLTGLYLFPQEFEGEEENRRRRIFTTVNGKEILATSTSFGTPTNDNFYGFEENTVINGNANSTNLKLDCYSYPRKGSMQHFSRWNIGIQQNYP
jgi:hypothetical protein